MTNNVNANVNLNVPDYVKNQKVIDFVKQIATLTKPDNVYWADGSQEEYLQLCDLMVKKGTLKKLNEQKRPNSFLALSDPSDVARVEDRTFICSKNQQEWTKLHPKSFSNTSNCEASPEFLHHLQIECRQFHHSAACQIYAQEFHLERQDTPHDQKTP